MLFRSIVNLDIMMARRKISLGELAEKIDITPANLSILKTGKAKCNGNTADFGSVVPGSSPGSSTKAAASSASHINIQNIKIQILNFPGHFSHNFGVLPKKLKGYRAFLILNL